MWVGKEAVPMAVPAERDLDLSFLNRKERRSVRKVLERDKRLRMIEAERVGRLFPGGEVKQGERSMFPLRTQSVWSTSASLSPTEANPPHLKASLKPSTQANTGGHANRFEDMSSQVWKPNLRSRITSLLSIKFLQRSNRDTSGSSRYREANDRNREMRINIVDMNISNSNIDTDSSRDMGSNKDERSSNSITHTSGSRDVDKSIGNEDTCISSDVHINKEKRDTNGNSYVHNSRDNRDTNISRDNRDTGIRSDAHMSRENRDTSISNDVHISSSCTDMGSSNGDASNSSSSRHVEINDHAVSHEKQPAIRKQKETDQNTDQTDQHRESSFQRTPLNGQKPTDQPQRVQHDSQSTRISKPINSYSSHASLLQTRGSPAEIGNEQPALPSEKTSHTPSPEQDTSEVGLSTLCGTVKRLERWVSEQQSTDGPREVTDQLQSKAFAFYDTKVKDKDRFTSDTHIPRPNEEERPLHSGTDTTEESLNSTKDVLSKSTSNKNKDSCEPKSSIPVYNTYQSRLSLWSDRENKREATNPLVGGTDTENSTHHFSNKNQMTRTSGIPLIKESVSSRRDTGQGPVIGVSMFSTPKIPKENDTNELFTKKSSFGTLTKQVTYTASQPTKTTEDKVKSLDLPPRANDSTGDTLFSTDSVRSPRASLRIPVWRSHLSYRHSSLDQSYSSSPSGPDPSRNLQDAMPRLNSYPTPSDSWSPLKVRYHPTGNSLVKAKSCEKLPQKAASVDSPVCQFPPASNLRSMSSSERINILAKQHANAHRPGGSCELKEPPHKQTWGRCNSTHEINSSQHSQIPCRGADNSRLAHNHRSLTVSNLTLPQHRLSKDRYPHQSKLSVFPTSYAGQSQEGKKVLQRQLSTFRSYDSIIQESVYRDTSLNSIDTLTDSVPNKKRDYPPHMSISQGDITGRSHINSIDISHRPNFQKYKVKEVKRWSSVSELENLEGHYGTQRQCFVKGQSLFTQNQTRTKQREFLLDSTGSQISLDCSSGDTDDDIFSSSPGQCRQGSPPNYLTAYDRALAHHRSSSNVYQTTCDRAPVFPRRSFGLAQGRSVSVSNISSNRPARHRRISAGNRTVTSADLRDFEDFENTGLPKPRTLSCTLDRAVSSGPVERFPSTGLFRYGGSLASSSGSLLSSSQVCLDNPFPSRNYQLTYVESEDSDSDTASEGEYYLYGQGEDLESPL